MDRLKGMPSTSSTICSFDLHSNMDRLKGGIVLKACRMDFNLHSNMDRLKDYTHSENDMITLIYIPIWID